MLSAGMPPMLPACLRQRHFAALAFKAIMALERQKLKAHGEKFMVALGMQVVAEINFWTAHRDRVSCCHR
jgi:hypothetical protein